MVSRYPGDQNTKAKGRQVSLKEAWEKKRSTAEIEADGKETDAEWRFRYRWTRERKKNEWQK